MFHRIRTSAYATSIASALILVGVLAVTSPAANVSWVPNADGDWAAAPNWTSSPSLPAADDDVVIDVGGATSRVISVTTGNQFARRLTSEEQVVIGDGNLAIGVGGGEFRGELTLNGRGVLTINGGSLNASATANLDGGSMTAINGGTLTIVAPSALTGASSFATRLRSVGDGSILDLSNVETFAGGTSFDTDVIAENGGKIDLSSVTEFITGSTDVLANGESSQIDLASLQRYLPTNAFQPRLVAQAGGQVLTGNLTQVNNVTVEINGVSSSVDLTNASNINRSSFIAAGGATLTVPAASSYTGSSTFPSAVRATGGGSRIEWANITTFNGGTNFDTDVQARDGGFVDLTGITSLDVGSIDVLAEGPDSQVDLSNLQSYVPTIKFQPRLVAQAGGQVLTGNLTQVNNVTVEINGVSSSVDLTNASNINRSSFIAAGGATLTVPAASSYTGSSTFPSAVRATGGGSRIEWANITTFNGGTNFDTDVQARDGGFVDLTGITSLDVGSIDVLAEGPDSQVDLSNLQSYVPTIKFQPRLVAQAGGQVLTGNLTQVNDVTVEINGVSSSVDLTNASNINRSSFIAAGGATLTVPAASSYTGSSTFPSAVRATGGGSRIEWANIATFNGGTNFDTDVQARDGGFVDLTGITSLDVGSIDVSAEGPDSQVDLSNLQSYVATNNFQARVRALDEGQVTLGGLMEVSNIDLETNQGTIRFGTLTAGEGVRIFGNGRLQGNVNNQRGNVSPGLTDVTSATLNISGDYAQGVDATMGLMLDGDGSRLHRVSVEGTVQLAGRLELRHPGGITPLLGETRSLVTGAAISGTFSSIRGVGIPGTLTGFAVFYSTTEVLARVSVVGDADFDNDFDSDDLITVFSAGEYFDAVEDNSTWMEGDWNGDADFDPDDLIAAFEIGAYNQGTIESRAAAVPEPSAWLMLGSALVCLAMERRIR